MATAAVQAVRGRSAVGARSWFRIRGLPASVLLGILGSLFATLGSANPSLWGDEAASILSAQRPLSSLVQMLGTVDAVHGVYYLFLHFWIGVFGASEFAVRLPSAIAVGFIVAGTVRLASLLSTRRVGILAGGICIVLPRISYLGAEARSYAITTAIAVWLTILLVTLLQKKVTNRAAWAGYAVGLAAGMYVFLYLALLVVVHGLYLLLSRSGVDARRLWLRASMLGLLLAIPIFVFGIAERGQIAFLAKRSTTTPRQLLVVQWFGTVPFAVIAWSLIVVAVVTAILAWRRHRRSAPLVLLGALWLLVPMVLLLALNVRTPSYSVRYLSFCAPAAAILIAVGLAALARRWMILPALAVVVALALPADIAARGPYAKDGGSDWRQVSQIVGASAVPGEAIVFDQTTRPSRDPRLALRLYPQYYRGLRDVTLTTPFDQTTGLWDVTAPLDSVTDRLGSVQRVWLLELRGSADHRNRTDLSTLERAGFSVTKTMTVNRTVIYTLSRGAA